MTPTTSAEKHFDEIAAGYDSGKRKYSFYYESLKKLLGSLIPHGKNVYEIGCGTGDLLNHLQPSYGYGYDISREMIKIANAKFQNYKQSLASQSPGKNLTFSTKWPEGKFDYIFMSDVIEHLENPKETFLKIQELMDNKTIFTVGQQTMFICTMANPIWEPLLMIWEKLELKMREGPHRRIKIQELRIMIQESGMRITKHDYKLLMPINIPIITRFVNKYLERYFKKFAFIEYFVAVKA